MYRLETIAPETIKSVQCSVPFRKVDSVLESAPIKLRLIAAAQDLQCLTQEFHLDMHWIEKVKDLRFQIRALRPGRYIADLVLLVNEKYLSAVHLTGEAYKDIIRNFSYIHIDIIFV